MSDKFEQISLKPGFMKHNGGVMFRNISNNEYEFKSTINENFSTKVSDIFLFSHFYNFINFNFCTIKNYV